MSHRMSYVRYLPEVGFPMLHVVSVLDGIQAKIRELECAYEVCAVDLQARVDKEWSTEERAAAWAAWAQAGCPTEWVEPRCVRVAWGKVVSTGKE